MSILPSSGAVFPTETNSIELTCMHLLWYANISGRFTKSTEREAELQSFFFRGNVAWVVSIARLPSLDFWCVSTCFETEDVPDFASKGRTDTFSGHTKFKETERRSHQAQEVVDFVASKEKVVLHV